MFKYNIRYRNGNDVHDTINWSRYIWILTVRNVPIHLNPRTYSSNCYVKLYDLWYLMPEDFELIMNRTL